MGRRIGFIVGALGLVVSGCGSSTTDSTPSTPKKTIDRTAVPDSEFKPTELEATIESVVAAIDKSGVQDIQLDMVLKSLNGFYAPIVVGANRAMSELGATGGVAAPESTDSAEKKAQQVTMVQSVRASKTQGLGLAALGAELVPEIDATVDAGIPVVLIDGDRATSKRDLYIGTLDAAAGTTGGESLKALLAGKSGTVVILGNSDPSWSGGYDRTMAAKDVLEPAGYTVSIVTADWSSTGETTNIAALLNLINTSDPPVVGMMGMFSNAYQCAMAAEQAGKAAGDITMAAFDFEAKTVSYMQSGYIKVTHTQRNYFMGYLTPYVLYGMVTLGKDKTKKLLGAQMVDDYRFDSGLDVVPAEKLDAYYTYMDSLAAGG
jgi:ribose transport system substrate-binding protein